MTPSSPAPRYPPARPGEVLLVDLARGSHSFVRVSLAKYEKHYYIALRVFQRSGWRRFRGEGSSANEAPDWVPTRKGCSIRILEVEPVCSAIREAVRLVDAEATEEHGRKDAP